MKIVTINGSPRKNGCTESLINKIAEGAIKKGSEITNFHPNEMNIKGCQACMTCKKQEKCAIEDDMTVIYNKIDEANTVILGLPIYFGEMNSQLKTVIDRLYAYVKADFSSKMKKDKKCILVVSQLSPNKDTFAPYIETFKNMLKMIGFSNIETFIAYDTANEHPEYFNQCYEIGLSLVEEVSSCS